MVIPSKFVSSEFEEMKNCLYCVEPPNVGTGLYWSWLHLLVVLLEETLRFTTEKVCKVQFVARFRNQYPMISLHIPFLRIYNSKSVFAKSWNSIRWNEPKHRFLNSGIELIICWRETSSILQFPHNNAKIVNCNRRHSISQYNEFSIVF